MESKPLAEVVSTFLSETEHLGSAVLVIWASEPPKATIRVSTNTRNEAAQGILRWMNQIDDQAIFDAAKALHESPEGCYLCRDSEGIQLRHPYKAWGALEGKLQAAHVDVARTVILAAKSKAGREVKLQARADGSGERSRILHSVPMEDTAGPKLDKK